MSTLLGFIVVIIFILVLFSGSVSRKSEPLKQYGVISYTQKGETVRSYAEKRLADYFKENKIQYEYEPGLKGVYANPDFYLPEHDVYVEYWGLLEADDPRIKSRYEKQMKRKMARYYNNKIKFISIYPRNLENLDWIFRKKFENIMGYTLPKNN